MRIIFNAYNLILGGGLSVGRGIAEALLGMDTEEELHVFLPRRKAYIFESTKNIKIHYIPRFFTDFAVGRFFAGYYLTYKADKLQADAVFSLGNYAIPVHCRQLLLLQWPYAVYPEKAVWSDMPLGDYIKRKLRLLFFRRNLKYATALTVQTEVMKERVKKYIPSYKRPVHVVESSFLRNDEDAKDSQVLQLREGQDTKLLLCMSEYYTHKNLEVLIPLAALIRKQKLDYKILLTIDPAQPRAAELLREVKRKGLSHIMINLGRIEQKKTPAIYRSCDALILPTLLESYGIPYLEAAYVKLPIFTSDLDFAHAINGDAAWYVDPLSPENILQIIHTAFDDPSALGQKTNKAFHKVNRVRTWEEITREYLEIIKNL